MKEGFFEKHANTLLMWFFIACLVVDANLVRKKMDDEQNNAHQYKHNKKHEHFYNGGVK